MNKSYWDRLRSMRFMSAAAGLGHIPTAAKEPQGVSNGNDSRPSAPPQREGQGQSQ